MFVDIVSDGHDEFFYIAEDAAPEPVLSQIAKEAFHHVEPGTARRREVEVKARMTAQPSLHLRMFVRGIVIDDQMQIFFRRGNIIRSPAGNFSQFSLMTVPVIAHADYRTVAGIQGGEEGRRPIPFVVVSESLGASPFQR